jgi:hypothetical protein
VVAFRVDSFTTALLLSAAQIKQEYSYERTREMQHPDFTGADAGLDIGFFIAAPAAVQGNYPWRSALGGRHMEK